jgi:hypothetical protein
VNTRRQYWSAAGRTHAAAIELHDVCRACEALADRVRAFTREHPEGCACVTCEYVIDTNGPGYPSMREMLVGLAVAVGQLAVPVDSMRPMIASEFPEKVRGLMLGDEAEADEPAAVVAVG